MVNFLETSQPYPVSVSADLQARVVQLEQSLQDMKAERDKYRYQFEALLKRKELQQSVSSGGVDISQEPMLLGSPQSLLSSRNPFSEFQRFGSAQQSTYEASSVEPCRDTRGERCRRFTSRQVGLGNMAEPTRDTLTEAHRKIKERRVGFGSFEQFQDLGMSHFKEFGVDSHEMETVWSDILGSTSDEQCVNQNNEESLSVENFGQGLTTPIISQLLEGCVENLGEGVATSCLDPMPSVQMEELQHQMAWPTASTQPAGLQNSLEGSLQLPCTLRASFMLDQSLDQALDGFPMHLPEPPESDPKVIMSSLPDRGSLFRAVVDAGPLLGTLMVNTHVPLPRWRQPPPQVNPDEIPRPSVGAASRIVPLEPVADYRKSVGSGYNKSLDSCHQYMKFSHPAFAR